MTELHQKEQRHYRQELSPKKSRRSNRRKLQQFKRITLTLARKRISGQRRTHGRHEATEQEHHVAFHTFHNLPAVPRHGSALASRQNHRRNDEGYPEFGIPKDKAKFMFKDVKNEFVPIKFSIFLSLRTHKKRRPRQRSVSIWVRKGD